jgi:hypothetical protein
LGLREGDGGVKEFKEGAVVFGEEGVVIWCGAIGEEFLTVRSTRGIY